MLSHGQRSIAARQRAFSGTDLWNALANQEKIRRELFGRLREQYSPVRLEHEGRITLNKAPVIEFGKELETKECELDVSMSSQGTEHNNNDR
ncbi:hypothetical protein NPIL_477271 [Nephila pilipes]|uniref:Uncharacterized protein n=1 Tax=Nephila pilipes TaxID=299642 RepID=A0A8X6PRJ4_NEPPI|nr:hypothetical protein NPIL_477271 [Nephila pilipes]